MMRLSLSSKIIIINDMHEIMGISPRSSLPKEVKIVGTI